MKLHSRIRTQVDPPEAWELDPDSPGRPARIRTGLAGHPYVPLVDEDIPQEGQHALEAYCGSIARRDIFVIPASTRHIGPPKSTGRRFSRVVIPDGVLGFGKRAIGLWVRQPEPHVVSTIPLLDLATIDATNILLYGRLRFRSADRNITVRYNAAGSDDLNEPLDRLRLRISALPCAVPGLNGQPEGEIPFKWKRIIESRIVSAGRSDVETSAAFAQSSTRRRQRGRVPHGMLLALTDREVVFARDPIYSDEAYGVDALFIPRSRLEHVFAGDDFADLVVSGTMVRIATSKELMERAAPLLEFAASDVNHST